MQQLVQYYLKKGFLLSPDIVKTLNEENKESFIKQTKTKVKNNDNLTILNKDLFLLVNNTTAKLEINWAEFEKSRSLLEKGKDTKTYNAFLDLMDYNISPEKKEILNSLLQEIQTPPEEPPQETLQEEETYPVIILKSYNKAPEKRAVQDFVSHYKARYNQLKKILLNRPELSTTTSISRIIHKQNREQVTLIGIVKEKSISKNNNIILTIEDITDSIKVVITQSNKELFEQAKDIVTDEVIGVIGSMGTKVVFTKQLFFPDIPQSNQLKKTPNEIYAAVISDIQVGSKLFLEEDFLKFIKWINGESGSEEQRALTKKVKYLFIVGDIVEGVGIFPNQLNELAIPDITEQYNKAAELFSLIRKDLQMILIPGNHDAMRLAEPQPILDKVYAAKMYEIPNITITTNPSLVNIASTPEFPGINVLMYHGFSFDYYSEQVESIRRSGKGISDRTTAVMKFLIQRRHLAPSHGSTLFIPEKEEDPLVIDKVPDIFLAGHIHKASIANYNNVTLIAGSCFQSKSEFQEKVGHTPEPSRVPLINLKTRETRMLKFA